MKPDGNERTQKKKIQKQIGIVVLCIVALFLLCMTEDFFRSSPSLDSKERFRSPTSEVQTPLAEDSAEVEGSAYSYGYSLSFYQDKVFFASEKLKGRLCFTEWKEPKKTHDTEVRAVHRFISKENLFYVVCRNSDIVVYDAEKDKILAKENLFNQLGTYYDVHLNGVDETGAYFSFITRGDSYIVRITPQGEFETVRTFEGQNTYLLLVDKGRLVYTYFHNEDDEEGTVVEDMQSHEKKKLNDLCTLTSGSGYPEALLWKDCLVAGHGRLKYGLFLLTEARNEFIKHGEHIEP